jgi:FAD/FMN-containing dehydrogenase
MTAPPSSAAILALRAALEGAAVPSHDPGGAWEDIARYPIGRPLLVAAPRDTLGVAAVVREAGARGVRVVPVGHRTAYWAPLHVEGAVALDLSGLQTRYLDDGVVEVGAGVTVRALDEALRAQGRHLPFRPDAFGDTTVAAMLSVGSTSGFGMVQGPASRWVAGLEVVTGEGRILRAGASAAWPHLPVFTRDGLPDATGLFFAAEGTLGIITRAWLHAPPAPHRVHLHARVAHAHLPDLLALGRRWVDAHAVETLRAARYADGGPDGVWVLDAWVRSTWSAEEAATRAGDLTGALTAETGASVRLTPEDEEGRSGRGAFYEATWQGPPGALAAWGATHQLVGLDVNVSWAGLPAVLDAAAQIVAAQQGAPGVVGGRTALYLAPELVNVGLHTTVRADVDGAVTWAHAHLREGLSRLWDAGVVPYRPGRAWPSVVWSTLDPSARALMDAAKAALDPHGVLHAHPMFRG